MAGQRLVGFNAALKRLREPSVSGKLARLFGASLRDMWRCLADLLLFDVLFKVLAFIILSPLVAWLFRQFVATSGNAAVGNLGLGVTILIAGLVCTVSFGELAGLMHIGYGAAQGLRITYSDALRFVRIRVVRILGASYLVLLILIAGALPFLIGTLITADYLLTQHDINYYLEAKPPEFVAVVVIGGVLSSFAVVVLILISVPLMFVLPQVLFKDDAVMSAFRHSRRLTKGHFGSILAAFLVWLLGTGLASLLLNSTIFYVGKLLVTASGQRVTALLISLGIITAVDVVLNLTLAFLSVALGCLVIVRLFREGCLAQGVKLRKAAAEAPSLDSEVPRRLPQRAPLAVSVIMLLLAAFVAYQLLESLHLGDHVEISAHRGASLVAPENTLSAVRKAIQDGATHVEIDVQRTADGIIVLAHDADLMRIAREPLVISSSRFEDLRSVDVGKLFSTEFTGERLPTLEEVIEEAKGKAKLIVELKSYGTNADLLVGDVVQMFESQNLFSDAVIMSLEYNEVQEVKRLDTRITTGFVASAALGNISKLNVDFLAVNRTMATNTFIATAHSYGKEVFVWTIDDPRDMAAMIDRGANNIITNDPAAVVRVLDERAGLSNAERILLRFKGLYLY
jgi:glycerophosphoryl diester phosphodiesterase